MTIGERIKMLREKYKITQTELADIIGTTKQNVYKYENGIIVNIPSDKIELIAKHFSVSPAYIMGWEEPNQNSISSSSDQLSDVYLSFAKDAQDQGIDPDDIRLAIETIKNMRKKNKR